MTHTLNIGLAGLGTVGTGVFRLLQNNKDDISKRVGKAISVVSVSARDKTKDRGIDLNHTRWADNPLDMVDDPDVDLVVELIGGEDGLARELVEKALENSKPVVTANKALMAKHGYALAELSRKTDTPLYYEAAIAGGIPIVKSIREGLGGNRISSVAGILNGTCNYILTEMERTGAEFDVVLKDAQEKGYAEANPSFDIDGIDAAHKICLLTSIAFGTKPDFDALPIKGIRDICSEDIHNAATLGYKIKLLAVAHNTDDGIVQKVSPCLIPADHSLAKVDGVLNAVYVTGDFVHSHFSVGPGAGEEPTASAVASDILDYAVGNIRPVLGVPASDLKETTWVPLSDTQRSFYLRLPVLDKPGVLAEVAGILNSHDISIETLIQIGRDPDQPVTIIMTTHEANSGQVNKAIEEISKSDKSIAAPCVIPIEPLDE